MTTRSCKGNKALTQHYPRISIVTPSYNQSEFIDEAIRSVIGQDYPDFEHIVLDNRSTDNTADILRDHAHLKVVCEPDKGQSDALNKGFKMATGDIIGWLNADDLYLPGCFEEVRDFFDKHPECDLFYGDYRFVDANGHIIRPRLEIDFDFFILKYLRVLYIPTASTFFRRRIFDESNWLNVNYRYAMDYDFFLKLALRGYRFGHLSKILANFRWHSGNKSLSVREGHEEHVASLLTHDPFLRSLPGIPQYLLRLSLANLAGLKRCWQKGVKWISR